MVEQGEPIYEFGSRLSREEAVDRLRLLGPSMMLPTRHPAVRELEVQLEDDPFGQALWLMVEQRPRGSYVTARRVPSGFLRDFIAVVHAALAVFAAVGLVASFVLSGSAQVGFAAAAAVCAGWVALRGLIAVAYALLLEDQARHATKAAMLRLRHQLANVTRQGRPS